MTKKIFSTALTVGVATALIAGNGVLSTYAFSYGEAQKVEVIGQHQQPESTSTEWASKVEISQMEDAPEMAAKRTGQDMNKEAAVEIAKKAIEQKFNVSLNGTYATPIFCTLEDMEGTFYFVSFVNAQDAKEVRYLEVGEGTGRSTDVYIAFVNSKTGEIVSAEKNPTAPEGIMG
ncbi:MAG TPA: hypothetical protein VE710_23030 [Candidatus Bathyarchaeia archaeon]|nr:hypothetical protein [Candidatus Bathyarchaeia archaeon]